MEKMYRAKKYLTGEGSCAVDEAHSAIIDGR